jgi:glyoxylase-like metal-dependent hydrolase (beta-lactamase superfamily II)
LFSGDTLFASGTLSTIFKSDSLGEYFNSLRRLKTMKIDLLLPGHGRISRSVEEDIEKTIKNTIEKFPEAKRLAEMFELD